MKRKGPTNEEKEGWDLAVGEGAVGVDVGPFRHQKRGVQRAERGLQMERKRPVHKEQGACE